MTSDGPRPHTTPIPPRAGQVVLPPVAPDLAPSEQTRILYRLGDPALSELGLEDFLEELLTRVRDALSVDTVAILLLDRESQQLVARAAKGVEEEVERGVRIPIGRGFAGRIATERAAIFIADVDHADILNPILREKGIRSLLGIPLMVEGEIIGVLHVGSLTPREFGMRDLAILQVAAARAAPGIERARLHSALEHEHRVAMVLQRSLLPPRTIETVGITAAARYLPATDEVGGDWYDIFELPQGRVGVAIGDVLGHGVRAAALMGQLRTALRAYAAEDHSPGRTLELVDRFVQTLPGDAMATAAYAVLDPDTGSLRIASAGHLPPICVGPMGTSVLDLPPSAPLGAVPYSSCADHETTLAANDTLVFYTDGLVERPDVPLRTCIEALRQAISGGGAPESVCRMALDEMVGPGPLRDDAAIVALQYADVPAELHLRLPADPQVLADVRRMVRRWLRRHGGSDRDLLEVTLAVGEACTNAIEHAYSPAPAEFELSATMAGDEARFVVSDAGAWRAPRGHNRGRGLSIMEAAMDDVVVSASDWGTEIVMRRRLGR